MPEPKKRYLLNLETKKAHDLANLTERCNTDAIHGRHYDDVIPDGYEPCEHCRPAEEADEEPIAY